MLENKFKVVNMNFKWKICWIFWSSFIIICMLFWNVAIFFL